MYIIFDKNSKIVLNQDVEKPDTISNSQEIAICNNIPKYDKSLGEYLIVTNLQEKTEKYTGHDFVEKDVVIDGEMQRVTEAIEVEKERNYFTCNLIVNENIKIKKELKIRDLKQKLREYDYVSSKLAEATARYIVSQDDAEIKALYTEYEKELTQKQAWRDEINLLENS